MTRIKTTQAGGLDLFIKAARLRTPVFQAKINHGFWEQWRAVERLQSAKPDMSPAELDRAVRRRFMVETGFLAEMDELLGSWSAPPSGPYLSCSPDAFPDESRLAPLPGTPRHKMEEILRRKAPSFSLNSDGMVWKQAVLEGSIVEFMEAVSEQQVIVVGPRHLCIHEQIWHWQSVYFLEIHPTDARKDRYEILRRLEQALAAQSFTTVLLQCGSLSAWLVAKLYRGDANFSVFDLGRSLDFIEPGIVLKQPWGAAHAQALAWHYGKRIKAWSDWIEQGLIDFPDGPETMRTTGRTPINYVERKRVDTARFEEQSARSRLSGHWANFGPGVKALEREILIREGLGDQVVPVTTSSGTAALWVAAGVAALHHGGPIRWVVSSFGFFSSAIGPLANSRIVDCDSSGMLSLSALAELDDSEYDGVIVTDLFGRSDLSRHIEFCRQHRKSLVIDAAAGWGREVYRSLGNPSSFSFHHTKPAGFGEGGCVFVPPSDAAAARSITNFGHDLPQYLKPYCGNWKLSDAQATLIRMRHARAAFWGPSYRLQFLRLRQIAVEVGIKVLESAGPIFGGKAVAPPASIALLLDSVVRQEALDSAPLPFVVRKYYRPLKETEAARKLYDRIVCIPTHPDLAAIDNAMVREGMLALLSLQEGM